MLTRALMNEMKQRIARKRQTATAFILRTKMYILHGFIYPWGNT